MVVLSLSFADTEQLLVRAERVAAQQAEDTAIIHVAFQGHEYTRYLATDDHGALVQARDGAVEVDPEVVVPPYAVNATTSDVACLMISSGACSWIERSEHGPHGPWSVATAKVPVGPFVTAWFPALAVAARRALFRRLAVTFPLQAATYLAAQPEAVAWIPREVLTPLLASDNEEVRAPVFRALVSHEARLGSAPRAASPPSLPPHGIRR